MFLTLEDRQDEVRRHRLLSNQPSASTAPFID